MCCLVLKFHFILVDRQQLPVPMGYNVALQCIYSLCNDHIILISHIHHFPFLGSKDILQSVLLAFVQSEFLLVTVTLLCSVAFFLNWLPIGSLPCFVPVHYHSLSVWVQGHAH